MDSRFFEVTITENWIETKLDFLHGVNHKDVAEMLPLKSKRVYNIGAVHAQLTEPGAGANI